MYTCCSKFHGSQNQYLQHHHNVHDIVEARVYYCPGHPLDANGNPEPGIKLRNISFKNFILAWKHEKGCSQYLQHITDVVGEVALAEIVPTTSKDNMWSKEWMDLPKVREKWVQCVDWMIGEDFQRAAVSLNMAYPTQFIFAPTIFYAINLNFAISDDKPWSQKCWMGFVKELETGIQGYADRTG